MIARTLEEQSRGEFVASIASIALSGEVPGERGAFAIEEAGNFRESGDAVLKGGWEQVPESQIAERYRA